MVTCTSRCAPCHWNLVERVPGADARVGLHPGVVVADVLETGVVLASDASLESPHAANGVVRPSTMRTQHQPRIAIQGISGRERGCADGVSLHAPSRWSSNTPDGVPPPEVTTAVRAFAT